MTELTILTDEVLLSLAPPPLSFRAERYRGDQMSVALADFSPADQSLIERVYAALGQILSLTERFADRPDEEMLGELNDLLGRIGWADLNVELRGLGGNLLPGAPPMMRQVVHDLKGGGYLALSVHLQLIGLGLASHIEATRIYLLTRDQLKIMRNAVTGLDDVRQARDYEERSHGTQLLVEKWSRARYQVGDQVAEIDIDCRFEGTISERCLEFSALDRALYNLVNNSALHSATGQVRLIILPADEQRQHLRIAVANPISAEQRELLTTSFPDGPSGLFRGGFSTTGSGQGMRICADFVANAYGLGSVEQGLERGYFGARVVDDLFVAWFHWPVAGD